MLEGFMKFLEAEQHVHNRLHHSSLYIQPDTRDSAMTDELDTLLREETNDLGHDRFDFIPDSLQPFASQQEIHIYADEADSVTLPIQEALNHAKPGMTIIVHQGVYRGSLYMRSIGGEAGKPVILRAAEGEEVVIDALGADCAIRIEGDTHFLECSGFAITNAAVAGICLNQEAENTGQRISYVLLSHNEISGIGRNVSSCGILAEGDHLYISHNRIYHNQGDNIRLAGDDCRVEANTLFYAGGNGLRIQGSHHFIGENHIHHNALNGIEVVADHGYSAEDLTITDNVLEENACCNLRMCGSGELQHPLDIFISNNEFSGYQTAENICIAGHAEEIELIDNKFDTVRDWHLRIDQISGSQLFMAGNYVTGRGRFFYRNRQFTVNDFMEQNNVAPFNATSRWWRHYA